MGKKEAVEAADILSVLEYIQEREGNLARATEKLRRNVERIANVFGSRDYCQICDGHKRHSMHFRYRERKNNRGINEIPEQIEGAKVELVSLAFDVGRWGDPERKIHYVEEHEHHQFVPKIFVSIEVIDVESFYERDDCDGYSEEYFIVINRDGMKAEVRCRGDFRHYVEIENLQRKAVKELVRSGRICKFLARVSKQLEETGKEYQEVAEVSERLTTALPQ